jgi:hypothetical protein
MSGRLREVREEIYGEEGGPHLAELLGISYQIWADYEGAGVAIPEDVIRRFVSPTGTSLDWLLTGDGPRYDPRDLSG